MNSESYKVMSTTSTVPAQPGTETAAGQPQTVKRFYSPEEFAAELQWHPESVRRAIRKGRIASVRFTRKLLIPQAEAARLFTQGL